MTPENKPYQFKTEFQPRLEQKMKLSFQQIQHMDILLLPLLELTERVYQELEQNPVLEMSDETGLTPADDGLPKDRGADEQDTEGVDSPKTVVEMLDDERDSTVKRSSSWWREISDRKSEAMQNTADKPQSLQDYLHFQFLLMDLPEQIKLIGKEIIYNIEDDGYLKTSLEDIAQSSAVNPEPSSDPSSGGRNNVSLEVVEETLRIIHKLDPPGVGARNLAECLLLQLSEDDQDMELKTLLIGQYLDHLQANKLPHLAKILDKPLDKVEQLVKEIRALKPHPAADFSVKDIPYIVPDVIINKVDDNYEIKIQKENFSSLIISEYYRQMMSGKEGDDATKDFIRQKMKSARELIQAIALRKITLRQVAAQILLLQQDFFDKGIKYLKPLRMKEVAKELKVHLSTISRTVSNKYIQTSHGIFSMKFFFSTTTETAGGNFYAQHSLQAALKEIVDKEDKRTPLNDSEIEKALVEKQFTISRRTVSKYRQLLNIPNYNQRKTNS